MTSKDEKDRELRRKEDELKKREQLLRLKEIENDIEEKAKKQQQIREPEQEVPFYPTRKDKPPETKVQRWKRKALNVAKFTGFVVATLVTIKVAYTVSLIIMAAGIGWLGYKIFLEKDFRD